LPNTDFDTGQPTRDGEYSLADETYAKLLRDLAKQGFTTVTPELRANLLSFYQNPPPPAPANKSGKTAAKTWPETQAALERLRALQIPAQNAAPALSR
jgi:hypothetical protein